MPLYLNTSVAYKDFEMLRNDFFFIREGKIFRE